MFSKREVIEPRHAAPKRMRLIVFVAAAAALAGVYAYVVPASDAARARAPLDDRPGIANHATIRPWGEDLSEGAVDSAGIERDLDGNASALIASSSYYENR